MTYTIAVCTYNRSDILERSILAALDQEGAPDYEVLAVDNNSTDKTAAVLENLSSRHARLRIVKETRQGLSHARNRAIKEAEGDFIIYVDDDAVLDPQYLRSLDSLLHDVPNLGAAGGLIRVGCVETPPPWFTPRLEIWCNKLDYGPQRRFLRYPQILYGTNMAFPKKVLVKIGGFHTGLGRSGKGLGDSEDLEIMLRLEKAGLPVVYDPCLSVTHFMTPDRMTREYFLNKAAMHGNCRYAAEKIHGRARPLEGLASWAISLGRTVVRPGRDGFSEKLIRKSSLNYFLSSFKI
ncbi:glycosyltransferase [Desulfatibacillum aliphaticivorans]|uniref:glycosyltransferase n=1 Tax=Desulfatibacillum aliphaticivorans TaxID=218208 RepID=UPI0004135F15|nr:glycosyltransferase [Desulfatibacillum aliphaticivorans]